MQEAERTFCFKCRFLAQWQGHARPCSDLSSLLEANLQKANRKL
jgi:hypothetical protein